VKKALIPTRIQTIKARIVDVAMSRSHTVCLTESGKVMTMGRNEEAQLGKGNSRGSRYGPELVKSMAKRDVSLIAAG
jgi:alpha-tubulin suppressor-like RCC1 family protein